MKDPNSRAPAKDAVVIIGAVSKAVRDKLVKAVHGKIAPLANVADTLVLEAKAEEPRKLFRKLNDIVGDNAVVAPVLVDQDGNRLFPTGRLQVRFKDASDESWLSDFAARHGLDFVKSNRWAPQQAEFAVRPSDSRFLPEIAAAVAGDKAVETAWPDVRAAYRRENA